MRAGNLWYKSAIIYQLDVRTFCDSNGDGWGDFQGLIRRLDYISGLGATAIWVKPFFPSPHRDEGYDISDYFSVDSRLGSLGDFTQFLEEAASRGIAVLTELVVNHTSVDHPWFQAAASSVDSPYRDFYIWRDQPPPPDESPEAIVWSDDDRTVWKLEPKTGQYYLHRFYDHQPDLNNAHPNVREEIQKILAFYLRLGISGLRLDAAQYLAEKAAEAPEYDGPHDYLRELRGFMVRRRPDAVFMAEADVEPKNLDEYFGAGDEMNLLLNFVLSQYIFLALAEEDARSIYEMVDVLPQPPPTGHYANFIRNHDELDLERLSPEARELVFRTYAPDESMRVYGRGIRRRAAPMLDGDRDRIRLAHSLLFAMPGTPIIYYGDEIGMGEDLSLEERRPVRTPMQWDDRDNAGFSTADPGDLYLQPIDSGKFGYRRVNVMDQRSDPDSMLNWYRRLVITRKECQAIASGSWECFDTGDSAVLGIRYEADGDVNVIYHNLGRAPAKARYPDPEELAFLSEIFADRRYDEPNPREAGIEIGGSGYRWLIGREVWK